MQVFREELSIFEVCSLSSFIVEPCDRHHLVLIQTSIIKYYMDIIIIVVMNIHFKQR